MKPHSLLLNPGPVTVTERVRQALTREDICHREPEFAELMLDIKARLAQVYNEVKGEFDPVILTGSGTSAVEAMLSTLTSQKSKILVISNGVYGERMAAMIKAQGKALEVIKHHWLSRINLDEVERRLSEDHSINYVVAVHNETTTGRLNDISGLGGICRKHNRRLLLDAVSSFGGEFIDFLNWNLDAVAATANKCLHGVPGIAFVLVKKSIFEDRSSQSQTLYLDLFRYQNEQRMGFSPFTPAVHILFALREALIEFEEQGGWRSRNTHYRTLSTSIRQCLNNLGVASLLETQDYSSMISSFKLPEGMTFDYLHCRMREAGFIIYAGQGELYNSIFRVANMGFIQHYDLERLLKAFRYIFNGQTCVLQ